MDFARTEEHSVLRDMLRSLRADLWQPTSSLDKELQ